MVVTLSHNSRRIDVDINLDNQADDHRLRVLIPTPFNTDGDLADTQFGSLTRPVNDSAMNNWQQRRLEKRRFRYGICSNYVALQETGVTAWLSLAKGLREFLKSSVKKKPLPLRCCVAWAYWAKICF